MLPLKIVVQLHHICRLCRLCRPWRASLRGRPGLCLPQKCIDPVHKPTVRGYRTDTRFLRGRNKQPLPCVFEWKRPLRVSESRQFCKHG
jgi:hypothetical protein